MQERHQNKTRYFQEQALTTQKYVVPYIEKVLPVNNTTRVFEIGCGEGGNLVPFLDLGCTVCGIDLSESRIKLAENFLQNHQHREKLKLITDDIYNTDYLNETFDLIILRDVIEHIPNQEVFIHFIKRFLKPGSNIFFGFPPWQNPFGGHQQIINHKLLSKVPYIHLLPKSIYRFILKIWGISDSTIAALLEIKSTGISIDRFEKIIKKEGYSINRKTFFFINPNYETKFKLKPREQLRIVSSIPWVRNFLITAAYYILSIDENHLN